MSYSPLFRGSNGKTSARSAETGYTNGTVSTLSKGIVVSTNTSGNLVKTDVSSEALVKALVGLMSADLPAASSGMVINAGRLENVATSFAFGDPVWLNKTAGGLTNIKPDVGNGDGFVSGDFVVFIGVITKNEFNGSLKDIQLMLQVVGQL